MDHVNNKLKIKQWAEEDRPREKMLLKGVSVLSDAELLAILIGSGNKNETAVELAQRILHSVNNNLNSLGKLSIKELINKFKGIGEAKAITIVSALELGKRRNYTDEEKQIHIGSSHDAYTLFAPLLNDLKYEEAWVLLMNRANKPLKKVQVSKGGISGTVVDIRLIIKEALDNFATGIILVHNHPSGNVAPSHEDNALTKKLKDASFVMDICLHDHIIIGNNEYFSYKDNQSIL